jgi:hypothetical protein
MSMQPRVDDYLAMRRSLGFKLRGEGRMLADFAARLDNAGQATITVSTALAWATQSQDAAPAHWRRRLGVVRGFARYLATLDPACQIPRLTCCRRRRTGHRHISTLLRRSPRSSTPRARSPRPCRQPPCRP